MDLKLPKLGEGADSGTVVNVFVKEGDTLAKDQTVIELENEKAVAGIPSTVAGVVARVFVKPGDKLSVGQRILTVSEPGQPAVAAATTSATATAAPAPARESQVEEAPASAAEEPPSRPVAAPVASPSIRRLARELGLERQRVQRILEVMRDEPDVLVAESLGRNHPVPLETVGMPDSFGESGEPDELLVKYGMKAKDVIAAAKKVIKRK